MSQPPDVGLPGSAGAAPQGRPAMDGALRSAISQAMTRIHAEYYGKGATQAKTYAFDNLVVCVLRDVFTTVERTLIDVDRVEVVREVRTTFQFTLKETFVSAVEQITGRRVASFMSQVDPAKDIAIEVFLFEPGEEDAPDVGA